MAQTATSGLDVLREAWSDTVLAKQFEAGNGPYQRIQKTKGTPIGAQLQTAVHTGRNLGGFTSVGPAGGDLNPAGTQQIDQATSTLVYNWLSVALDTSAMMQSSTQQQAIISLKDLEIENGIENAKHQVVRMLMTDGDGIVAACDTTSSSTTIKLKGSPSGSAFGYDALRRGWLGVGSVVDIGTTSDTDTLATGVKVTGVDYSDPTAPTITISGSAIATTAGTHFVYIANPNSATAHNTEIQSLRQIFNSSGSVSGIDPSDDGSEYWVAAKRDTATTVFSLDMALSLQRESMQNTGEPGTDVWTGLKQQANFYSLLQNQVRFAGDVGFNAGSVSTVKWNGMTVDAFPDVLDSDWFQFNLKDLRRPTGQPDGPQWASKISGLNGPQWVPDTTTFKDAVCIPAQITTTRRNGGAAATGLTA